MDKLPPPIRLLVFMLAGWVNREQRAVIDYLKEENAVLLERMGGRRLRLKDSGVKPVRLPARSANLNAYAQRFVLSIKSECLDRIVPIGERHLRLDVTECAEHHHIERPHQGLGNRLIAPDPGETITAGEVKGRKRLGGMLSLYHRKAA